MENKKVVPTWVSVILLALCAVSLFGCIKLPEIMTESSYIVAILSVIATIFAILYCLKGYKKNAAKYFMAFSVSLALTVLLQINNYIDGPGHNNHQQISEEVTMDNAPDEIPVEQDHQPFSVNLNCVKIIILVLIFAILFTLTVAKDLGKKKSYCLVGSAVILSLANYIINIVEDCSIHTEFRIPIGPDFAISILCIIYGVMIYAKYQDKAARGTK